MDSETPQSTDSSARYTQCSMTRTGTKLDQDRLDSGRTAPAVPCRLDSKILLGCPLVPQSLCPKFDKRAFMQALLHPGP
jgi:hypothetical protein